MLDEGNPRFKNVRKGFVSSVLREGESGGASWFVTSPPCPEESLHAVAEDLSMLAEAVRERLLDDPEIMMDVGDETLQALLRDELERLNIEREELKERLEGLRTYLETEPEDGGSADDWEQPR